MHKNLRNIKPPYFEGWYFKHDNGSKTISFVVGRNIDYNGAGSAFIQIITEDASYNINYNLSEFRIFKKNNTIKIAKSFFSENGVYIDIDTPDIKIKGKINYSRLIPYKKSIMGPFDLIPNFACSHKIISMEHRIFGKLHINSKLIEFKCGYGYIESDSGHSFPEHYTWVQCNNFENIKASLMLAVADISLFGKHFDGTVCAIRYKNSEYRLATYLGAKVEFCTNFCIIITQGKYKLVVKLSNAKGHKLFAPKNGNMSRAIEEYICAAGKVWFYEYDRLIFYGNSRRVSYEVVK